MPKLNRRRFLQVTGAAGIAPMMPALPSSAAAVSGSATHAQMLWASLFAKAGNAKSVAGVASAMGVSQTTAQGIYTKLAHANLLAAPGARALGHATVNAPTTSAKVPSKPQAETPRFTKENVRKWLADDLDTVGEDHKPTVDNAADQLRSEEDIS